MPTQNTKTEKLNKARPWIYALIIVAALAVTSLVGAFFAKYIANFGLNESQITMKDFYFTVDLMGDTLTLEDTEENFELYGGGNHSLTFNAQNFFDTSRITAVKTSYKLNFSASNGFSDYKIMTGSSEVADGDEFELAGGTAISSAFTLDVSEGYSEGTVITVTVSSSEPYSKILVMTFTLHTYLSDVLFRVEDVANGAYANLIIMANKQLDPGEITVDFSEINALDNVIKVDTTNAYVLDSDLTLTTNKPEDGLYIKSFVTTLTIDAQESISVFFFKSDRAKDYSTGGDLSAIKNSDGTYKIVINENGGY